LAKKLGRELWVVWVGRRRPQSPWEELCADYRKRIERRLGLREVVVRPGRGSVPEPRLAREAESIRRVLPNDAFTVALDRRGRALDSLAFARELMRRMEASSSPLVFVLGSDLGLHPDFRDACRRRISLGPMTFPHQLARLLLYEQLYRALSIANGIKYHRTSF
jgi:23S rRNA (pseudouridine1915-N3)-methyltransferase